ncbi:MAG TPA: hypothetical protein VH988_15140 [Thermoanaerobaculia bacterium]|jgi:hypothetical protein|nr:hypothetical protein [Thermoanaerobaculia bacterium]
MPTSTQEPSVRSAPSIASEVVWRWNGGETEALERAREAAAARKRGLLGGVIGLSVAAVFYFLLKRPVAAAVVAAIALLFALLALLAPLTAYKSVTRALDRFAHLVGTAVTWVLLTIMYYLFFLPLGWFLRLRGKLAITRSFDPGLKSYWMSLEDRARTPESYRRQF